MVNGPSSADGGLSYIEPDTKLSPVRKIGTISAQAGLVMPESAVKNPLVRDFSPSELSRIVEMAWEDRTPFEAIEFNFGLNESAVISLMRQQVKARSFHLWRKRVTSRKTKHQSLRSPDVSRGYCPTQYKR